MGARSGEGAASLGQPGAETVAIGGAIWGEGSVDRATQQSRKGMLLCMHETCGIYSYGHSLRVSGPVVDVFLWDVREPVVWLYYFSMTGSVGPKGVAGEPKIFKFYVDL